MLKIHSDIVPNARIENKIFLIRGNKVMFDRDLAMLYGVSPKALNQAVQRNMARFPDDFMFKLSKDEMAIWKSQIVTSTGDAKGLRKPLSVFTEQGVAMLSGVLKSKRAIQVHIQIIRTFTKLREMIASNAELRKKLEALERKYDDQFSAIFKAIKSLVLKEDEPKRGEIGFKTK